jgi:hypothetical protein
MTQEEKDLLLKDLCARLPYRVKVQIPDKYGGHTSIIKNIDIDGYVVDSEGDLTEIEWAIPYLFPLSSMTEEQYDEYTDMGYSVTERGWSMANYHQINWLNKNHFDYHGLIPMGLAIDATNLHIY